MVISHKHYKKLHNGAQLKRMDRTELVRLSRKVFGQHVLLRHVLSSLGKSFEAAPRWTVRGKDVR